MRAPVTIRWDPSIMNRGPESEAEYAGFDQIGREDEWAIRPLRRVSPGYWESRDGRWAFLQHHSDPQPQRWFAYLDGDEYPSNEGSGHVTLRDVVRWAERQEP